MRGKNPIRPPIFGEGQKLEVKNIFPTLQGEGLYAGVPSVFVRLGGCNLACVFCDTEFEDAPTMPLADIMAQVRELAGSVIKLVVITGGEPFRQNIAPFCEALLADGFSVQIETNGTLYRELPEAVDIVCSPKNTGMGYMPIREDLLPRISALKYIISASNLAYNHIPDFFSLSLRGGATANLVEKNWAIQYKQKDWIASPLARNDEILEIPIKNIPIFVQPMDEYDVAKNAANTKLALELAMQHGYRLSLQLHKILNIE